MEEVCPWCRQKEQPQKKISSRVSILNSIVTVVAAACGNEANRIWNEDLEKKLLLACMDRDNYWAWLPIIWSVFSDSFDNRSKMWQELLLDLLTSSFVDCQPQILLYTQRNTMMVPTVICILVGCGWFPAESGELSLDWKSLPGIGSRLVLHKYCQFTLSIFSKTKKTKRVLHQR